MFLVTELLYLYIIYFRIFVFIDYVLIYFDYSCSGYLKQLLLSLYKKNRTHFADENTVVTLHSNKYNSTIIVFKQLCLQIY